MSPQVRSPQRPNFRNFILIQPTAEDDDFAPEKKKKIHAARSRIHSGATPGKRCRGTAQRPGSPRRNEEQAMYSH
jgi:hypothetical protein